MLFLICYLQVYCQWYRHIGFAAYPCQDWSLTRQVCSAKLSYYDARSIWCFEIATNSCQNFICGSWHVFFYLSAFHNTLTSTFKVTGHFSSLRSILWLYCKQVENVPLCYCTSSIPFAQSRWVWLDVLHLPAKSWSNGPLVNHWTWFILDTISEPGRTAFHLPSSVLLIAPNTCSVCEGIQALDILFLSIFHYKVTCASYAMNNQNWRLALYML